MNKKTIFDNTEPLSVREIGSFHIGGQEISLSGLPVFETRYVPGGDIVSINPNGGYECFQMYAQYVKLAQPRGKYPLLMFHGGGMTGVNWETKPDGAPGFQFRFLQAGYDVYISDAAERGRASWARYPEINTCEPVWRPKKQAWENFRIGPMYHPDAAKRVAYPGCKFPAAYFDQFCKQTVARFPASDEHVFAAYRQYIGSMFDGGCVIMAHSQGAAFAYDAALRYPEKVKGLILLEPSPIPAAEQDIALMKEIPVLYIFGELRIDYWMKIRSKQFDFSKRLEQQGNDITFIDLPDLGIGGNTHMLMMDENSDEIALMIHEWLEKKSLYTQENGS